jgi:hypothetical protein
LNRKTTNRLIIINLTVAFLVFIDLTLPYKSEQVKELSSFYGFTSKTNTLRPTYDDKIILSLTNGERFRIGRMPDNEYKEGQKIIITKSKLFNCVNKILILDSTWKKINVGMFSNFSIFLPYILAVIFTISNVFHQNKILWSLLFASTMFIIISSIIYINYF